jgi:hypothetical protein
MSKREDYEEFLKNAVEPPTVSLQLCWSRGTAINCDIESAMRESLQGN